jgi:hypothetical protein
MRCDRMEFISSIKTTPCWRDAQRTSKMAAFREDNLRMLNIVGFCPNDNNNNNECGFFVEFSKFNFLWMSEADLKLSRKGCRLLEQYEAKYFAEIRRITEYRKAPFSKENEFKVEYVGFPPGHGRWVKASSLDFEVDITEIHKSTQRVKKVEQADVAKVLGKRSYGCTDETMFLVRWSDYPRRRDGWVKQSDMNFKPPSGIPSAWEETKDSEPKRRKSNVRKDEWAVFRDFFLSDIRYALRYGWRSSRTTTGRVRAGIKSFCPPAAYERLLGSQGVIRVSGDIRHHTFAHARDVPHILIGDSQDDRVIQTDAWGPITLTWWRLERPSGIMLQDPNQPGESVVEQWELLAFLSPVVFHYYHKKNRMTVSFTYSYGIRSELDPCWSTLRGPKIPLDLE